MTTNQERLNVTDSTPGRVWPLIDPKVLRMGVSKIRQIDSEWLHRFAANGEIAVIQAGEEPLSVLVPYAIYQSMQAPILSYEAAQIGSGTQPASAELVVERAGALAPSTSSDSASVSQSLEVEDAREEAFGAVLSYADVLSRYDVPPSKQQAALDKVRLSFDALILAVSAPLKAENERLRESFAAHVIQCPQCHEAIGKIGGA